MWFEIMLVVTAAFLISEGLSPALKSGNVNMIIISTAGLLLCALVYLVKLWLQKRGAISDD